MSPKKTLYVSVQYLINLKTHRICPAPPRPEVRPALNYQRPAGHMNVFLLAYSKDLSNEMLIYPHLLLCITSFISSEPKLNTKHV